MDRCLVAGWPECLVRGNDTGGEQSATLAMDCIVWMSKQAIRLLSFATISMILEKVPLTSGIRWLTDGFSFVTRVSGPKVGHLPE